MFTIIHDMSAVGLLESGQQRYIKATNNMLRLKSGSDGPP